MLQAFRQKWVSKEIGDSHTPIKHLYAQRPARRAHARPLKDLHPAFSARSRRFSVKQIACLVTLVFLTILLAVISPATLAGCLYWMMWTAFMGNAVMRLAACCVHVDKTPRPSQASNENMPTYSVIVALYKEASIVPQVLQAMLALNYPRDRLEILFALEADDEATIDAFRKVTLPPYVQVITVPPGFPRTKPRALNHVLSQANGDLVVIYDAEDRPHPDQLMRAAETFTAGPSRLACLQAPLRPSGGHSFIARQFTLEYAVQFDILLPAMNALGLPFPLGGTSNHFKAEVLKDIGGWDAWNVTEDADLGLRLAQYGYRLGLIDLPTIETPPASTRVWIPQRTRWIKGYMQTLLVHTRLSAGLKLRAWLSLILGVGLSAAAAICYAPFTFMLVMSLLMIGLQFLSNPAHPLSQIPITDIVLFATGTLSAMLTLLKGAQRTGFPLRLSDIARAPVYWCLQSVAAGFALHQLLTRPFHWDKTEHAPDPADKALYAGPTDDYAEGHDHHGHRHDLAHTRMG